jgi:hypothetical protein
VNETEMIYLEGNTGNVTATNIMHREGNTGNVTATNIKYLEVVPRGGGRLRFGVAQVGACRQKK